MYFLFFSKCNLFRNTCQIVKKSKARKTHFQIYPCECECSLSSTLQRQPSQRPEVLDSGGGVLIEWERSHSKPSSLMLHGSLLERPSRPKPLFPHCLPCGLNGFRSPLFPLLAAHRSGILLLPMVSADEAATFSFSSCSLGRGK